MRHVEQLLERVDADDTGLAEQRVDGGLGAGQRGRVRCGCTRACVGPSTLHRNDGLAARYAPGDAAERPGVAERLDVEQHDVGALVALPVLQEVVGADVGLVADRHEGGHAEAEATGLLEDGDPQRPRLRRERHASRTRWNRSERRVHAHGRCGVHHAHAVGPDHAHAVAPSPAHQLTLGRIALRTGLSEAGRDHDQPPYAFLGALLDHLEHVRGRHDDHRQLDVVGDVDHGRVGAHAGHVGRGGVDGVHGPREVALEEVAEDLVSDRPPFPPGADHRDRPGPQQPLHGSGRRPSFAVVHRLLRRLGRLDGEHDAHDTVGEAGRILEAGRVEEIAHATVLRQRVGDEPGDAVRPGDHREVLEQDRAEPPTLVGVVDGERHLCLGAVTSRIAVIARHRDHLVVELGDERHAVVVVDLGEAFDLARREHRVGCEEAEVDRLLRQAGVQCHERVGVGRADGTDMGGTAVGQHHVGLPLRRVAVRRGHGGERTRPPPCRRGSPRVVVARAH